MIVQILCDLLQRGRSLSAVVPSQLTSLQDTRDRSLVQACVYGVVRNYDRLSDELDCLLAHPLKQKDLDVQLALLAGIYELRFMRTPDHAAVSSYVETVRERGKAWACSLTNAVLRKTARSPGPSAIEKIYYEQPEWLLSRMREQWPQEWETLVAGNQQRAPMTLRVNTRFVSRADYLEKLLAADIEANPGRIGGASITLTAPVQQETLPGFREGHVSIQDEAAQLAVELLDPRPGERVLDACAAPGGKTGYAWERMAGRGDLVALEADPIRYRELESNLRRIRVPCVSHCVDAVDTKSWWDGQLFDRILLDSPCSAVGVIRRHPDIRFLRRESDIKALQQRQRELLRALWPLLRPGGVMLYSTCSFLREENDEVVEEIVRSGAQTIAPTETWGRATRFGLQVLPGEHSLDGFYYARLKMPADIQVAQRQ